MISNFSLEFRTSSRSINLGDLEALPEPVQDFKSFAELGALTNFNALEAAIPSDGAYGGLDQEAAQIIAGAVYGLVQYIAMEMTPKRFYESRIVGELVDGEWIFFVPSCGVTMKCDSTLSFGSQVFEFLPEYMADIADKLGYEQPWYYPFNFTASSFAATFQPPQDFWTLHKKTTELI